MAERSVDEVGGRPCAAARSIAGGWEYDALDRVTNRGDKARSTTTAWPRCDAERDLGATLRVLRCSADARTGGPRPAGAAGYAMNLQRQGTAEHLGQPAP